MVAGLAVPGSMEHLFRGLVEQEVIDAYEQLRASNGCRKDQAEAFLGDPALVSALTSRGMAHILPHTPADPAWLRPAVPGHRAARRTGRAPAPDGRGPGTPRRGAPAAGRHPGQGQQHDRPAPRAPRLGRHRPGRDQRAVGLAGQHRPQGLDDPGEPGYRHAADRGLRAAAAARRRRPGPVPVHLRRRRDAGPGHPADHPGLRRRWGAGPAAAQRADEDEARRLQHRAAPPHAERNRRGAADPRTSDHRRAAGVLRAAVGPGHTAQAAAPGTAGGPAATRPAGGAGTDGRRAQRCCDRAAAGHQRGHGAPVHRGHHWTGSASPAGSPPGPRRSAEDGSGRGVRYENRRAPWSTASAGR